MIKKCYKCGTNKDTSDFHKDKYSKDGYRNMCKSCAVFSASNYNKRHRKKINERMKNKYQIDESYRKDRIDSAHWDNYGTYWNIDHIKPQSKLWYDSFECQNFLECWSLDNLRPLEVIKNMKKGNK